MAQMNLSAKQKHIHREQTYDLQGRSGHGKGRTENLGLADVSLGHREWADNRVLPNRTGGYSPPSWNRP